MRLPDKKTLLPIMALLLLLDVTVTVGMLSNSSKLDILYGNGKQAVLDQQIPAADYYPSAPAGKHEARQAAAAVAEAISDEGIVLLKNNGILPLRADCPVSPFGYGYFQPLYCGTGSSAIATAADYVVTPSEGLHAVFTNINTELEQAQEKVFNAKDTQILKASPIDGSDFALCEFAPSICEACPAEGSVGLVFLTRQAGEYQDYHMGPYDDGTPHMLALTQAEHRLIEHAKDHCGGTVVILSCSTAMQIPELEDDPGIDAILWIGGAGYTGYASLGKILIGEVVPSGRTPILFSSDFTRDSTFSNQDDSSDRFVYANAVGTILHSTDIAYNQPIAFREYEEGVYYGYRYYETAFSLGALEDYYSRENGVVYPFGYGLSYTAFDQKILGCRCSDSEINMEVQVTNTGSFRGKDTVELYLTPPWTKLDVRYGIEKPSVSLLQFAKTDLLAPGESERITLTVSLDDLTSYCSGHPNSSGSVGCYILESGSYLLSIRANSHEVLDSCQVEISSTVWYDESNPRQSEQSAQSSAVGSVHAAVNLFPQLNAYMNDSSIGHAVSLTRRSWADTQPTAPDSTDRTAADTVLSWIQASGPEESAPVSEAAVFPISGADNGLHLIDMRGRSYDDPLWDPLLDQMTYEDKEAYRRLLFESRNQTGALDSIGKPSSVEHDGPQGFTYPDIYGKNWLNNMTGYPAVPVQAATWNKNLMYAYGAAVAQEGFFRGIDGWYAPGLNLQRSPFGGRASEYFGEDPILAGWLAERIVSGAGDNGLACAIKHFVLIDTEAHRSAQTCVWLTEQALREIYLRPFEIVVKHAVMTVNCLENGIPSSREMRAATMIMTSDNAIGTEWTTTSPELLTLLLRDEWGFRGTVISDMHTNISANTIGRMLYAGCDLLMTTSSGGSANAEDYAAAAGQQRIRRAVKNLCYTLANTNLMQGLTPDETLIRAVSPWMFWLYIINGITVVMLLIGCIICTMQFLSEKRIVHSN